MTCAILIWCDSTDATFAYKSADDDCHDLWIGLHVQRANPDVFM